MSKEPETTFLLEATFIVFPLVQPNVHGTTVRTPHKLQQGCIQTK